MDDFPVLKAFQQYIDAEQAKARKRMAIMGIFATVFGLSIPIGSDSEVYAWLKDFYSQFAPWKFA